MARNQKLVRRWMLFIFVLGQGQLLASVAERFLQQWRSADRQIPGDVLQNEANIYLDAELKREIRDTSESSLLKELLAHQQQPWLVSRADAENLLKIRKLLCHAQDCTDPYVRVGRATPFHNDEIKGAESKRIAELTMDFVNDRFDPAVLSKKPKRLFDYSTYQLTKLSLKSMIDNDAYAFTVAAILFDLGLHKQIAVFENATRGADPYPFMVAAGQDEAIDILEHARFTRNDIEVIRSYVEPRVRVSEDFYKWLSTWQFRGRLRTVPVGTVIFPGTPVNQIIADPASAILVESLINPWMSSATNLLTTAVRIDLASGKKARFSDGGTRRLVTGNLSARTALLGGADATSNLLIAKLFRSPAYGTVNHALMAALEAKYADPLTAMEEVIARYKGPGLVLPDTTEILTGLRDAVLAGGDLVKTFRQDSQVIRGGRELPTLESVEALRRTWRALGRGEWEGVLTNDLTEDSLSAITASGVPIELFSLGGALATSSRGVSHGNFVYKLVELRDGQSTYYPIKVASPTKSTEPGEKDLYRLKKNGVYVGDIKTAVGEDPKGFIPKGTEALPLIVDGFSDAKGRLMDRAYPTEVVPRIEAQLAHLDPLLLDLKATRKSLAEDGYSVTSSARLKDIRESAIKRATPKLQNTTLYVILPKNEPNVIEATKLWLDPLIAAHVDSANPYGPTAIELIANESVRKPQLDAIRQWMKEHHPKVKMSSQSFLDDWQEPLWSHLVRASTETKARLAIGQADFNAFYRGAMATDNPLLHAFDIFVMGQNNLYHRSGDGSRLSFGWRPNGLRSTSSTRVIFMNPKELEYYRFREQEKFDFRAMLHVTDAQTTFRYLSENHPLNGSLAVPGTNETVPLITSVLYAALKSEVFKTSFSGDAHLKIEMMDPQANGEFHAPFNFPEHGMEGKSGPKGEDLIPEIAQTFLAADIAPTMLRVPAHKVAKNRKTLVLAPFDWGKLKVDVLSRQTILRFAKNGPGSFSIKSNPRYGEYLGMVDPRQSIPHFHMGWCTDFCDYHVMREELLAGYRVIFIYDAAVGVGKKTTGKAMRELVDLGLVLMTSQQFVKLISEWKNASAETVFYDTERFIAGEGRENINKVLVILSRPEFADPAEPGELGESCALLWE